MAYYYYGEKQSYAAFCGAFLLGLAAVAVVGLFMWLASTPTDAERDAKRNGPGTHYYRADNHCRYGARTGGDNWIVTCNAGFSPVNGRGCDVDSGSLHNQTAWLYKCWARVMPNGSYVR
jgi:hypothetical protein